MGGIATTVPSNAVEDLIFVSICWRLLELFAATIFPLSLEKTFIFIICLGWVNADKINRVR